MVARKPGVHRESLLRIPLVAHAFSDAHIRPHERAIDRHWSYEGYLAHSMTGFNPFAGRFYYGTRSRLADWMKQPAASARAHNPQDQLVGEVLFATHDYLHCWTYGLVRTLVPKLGLGTGRITARNLEDLVFAHLVTEAAATVGLDYWYLSTVELDRVCPIGTGMATLTVDYRERRLAEYRRARPDLTVQDKRFFDELAVFYCTGVLHGFDHRDVSNSPQLDRWLRHELVYGVKQRTYVREWFSLLGGIPFDAETSERPVEVGRRWQRELMRTVGDHLWALVKSGKTAKLAIAAPEDTWAGTAKLVDPRFVNVNTLDRDQLDALGRRTSDTPAFSWLMDQYLSRFDYSRFDRDKLPLLPTVRERRSWKALHALCKAEAVVTSTSVEPRDLMLLN